MRTKKRALLIIEPVYDFMPGGKLAVIKGDEIVPLINVLLMIGFYDYVVVTQDWHPEDHCSFKVWPVHCVIGSDGAKIHQDLNLDYVDLILRKGKDLDVDYHSAFYSEIDPSGKRRSTGLVEMLRALGITHVDVTGLAFEICVKLTAIDAQANGFSTRVLKAYTRSIDLAQDQKHIEEMEKLGIEIVNKILYWLD